MRSQGLPPPSMALPSAATQPPPLSTAPPFLVPPNSSSVPSMVQQPSMGAQIAAFRQFSDIYANARFEQIACAG
jgi:hypothetical protein